jgi:hypothetical protein
LCLVGRKTVDTSSSASVVLLDAVSSGRSAGSRSAAGGSGKDGLGNDGSLDTGRAGNGQSGSRGDSDGLAVNGDDRRRRAVGNEVSGVDCGVCGACSGSDQSQRSSSGNARGSTRVGVCRVASIGGRCPGAARGWGDQGQRTSS